jgi:hypothetical protein
VAGVLRHHASREHAVVVCDALGIEPTIDGIFNALPAQCDVLDAAMARLLYWTDRKPLPAFGDVEAACDYYLRNWGPGAYTRGGPEQKKSLRRKWAQNYAKAMDEVIG